MIEKKMTGGIKFAATVPLTKLGPDPAKTIYSILHEYKMHNAHVWARMLSHKLCVEPHWCSLLL